MSEDIIDESPTKVNGPSSDEIAKLVIQEQYNRQLEELEALVRQAEAEAAEERRLANEEMQRQSQIQEEARLRKVYEREQQKLR